MNARFEAKIGMARRTNIFLTGKASFITSTNAVILNTCNTDLGDQITAIKNLLKGTEVSTKPVTALKAWAKAAVATSAASLASTLYAYALDTSNLELETEMKPLKIKSYLYGLKDEFLVPRINIIYTTALGLVTVTPPAVNPLGNYGVGTADTTALAGLITTYEERMALPEGAIEARKALNIQLEVEFERLDYILTKADTIVDSLAPAYSDFAAAYYAARNIFDSATTHTKIRGTVIDAATSLPIQGAKVKALSNAGTIIEVLTNEKGKYTVYTPKFKETPYNLLITKAGYNDYQDPDIFVKLGKITNKNIQMKKV